MLARIIGHFRDFMSLGFISLSVGVSGSDSALDGSHTPVQSIHNVQSFGVYISAGRFFSCTEGNKECLGTRSISPECIEAREWRTEALRLDTFTL
jgi:hypothetical protein